MMDLNPLIMSLKKYVQFYPNLEVTLCIEVATLW